MSKICGVQPGESDGEQVDCSSRIWEDSKKMPKYAEYIAAQKAVRALAEIKRETKMDKMIVELEDMIKRAKKEQEKWAAEAHDAYNTLLATQHEFEAERQVADEEEQCHSAKFREAFVRMKSYHKVIECYISGKFADLDSEM